VLDARARERFTGEVTMVDPRPGHVPGARNAPWPGVLDADGRFRSPDELRAHYASLGIGQGTEVIAYCGSGVSACMNLIGLEQARLGPARLYVASWSGWSADPDRPAELGA
jgi:thiosulfate/3-mercaptopyruvate sulfurtransferase